MWNSAIKMTFGMQKVWHFSLHSHEGFQKKAAYQHMAKLVVFIGCRYRKTHHVTSELILRPDEKVMTGCSYELLR